MMQEMRSYDKSKQIEMWLRIGYFLSVNIMFGYDLRSLFGRIHLDLLMKGSRV
jgi:hypothetical protein